MRQEEIQAAADEMMQMLRDSGCVVENEHFVHISKLHLNMWLNKDAIFPHVDRVERLARLLSARVADRGIEIVCGPAMGGLVVSEWVAHELRVMVAFAEHDPAPAPDLLQNPKEAAWALQDRSSKKASVAEPVDV